MFVNMHLICSEYVLKALTMFCDLSYILASCYVDYFEVSLVILLLSSFWERMEVVKIEALAVYVFIELHMLNVINCSVLW